MQLDNTWIEITNQGKEIPLWGIRVLGLSTKDENKIGKFGSGLKESIALLTRLGAPLTICSGECVVQFSTQNIEEIDEICFQLSHDRGNHKAGQWHSLNLHPQFGHHDWRDPWQAMRELVCNALDESEDPEFKDLSFTLVSEIKPEANTTKVYVPAIGGVLQAYSLLDKRLIPMSKPEPVWQNESAGSIYRKEDIGLGVQGQIFHRGVWVQEANQPKSIFDYNLNGLRLNESRSADWYHVHNQISLVITASSEDVISEFLLTASENRKNWGDYCESQIYGTWFSQRVGDHLETWTRAFRSLWGSKAVLCPDDQWTYERLKTKGKYPVLLPTELHRNLMDAGLPGHRMVLSENEQEGLEILPDKKPDSFDRIWRHMRKLVVKPKPKPRVVTFRANADDHRMGFVRDEKVHINEAYIGSEMERHIVIEEVAHYLSDNSDETRNFQNTLVGMIDRQMQMIKP